MGKLKLTDKTKEQIIADYKAGISQNQLAKNYKLSPATINKLCKNIPQENVEIVNTLVNTAIATNRALEGKSQIEVNSIERIVDERTKHLLYFQNAALRNQKIADEMLEMSDKIADVEAHSRITARNKETIFGKEPQTIINNTNAQQNEVTEIRRTIVKLDK
ncbi:hypothetical protein [Campylobacter concisus]|uniref:hypothetical protein n=1 Tax=Campylobacter concisus TaxID=199 RepID=UPI000925CCAA|nr:hypothetical protein [Campylobacter concisus]OJJ28142.1 hypothetical protein TH67_07440 [Campylobacter concisus]DAY06092.1 MAG TPA: InsA C-terminal domain [Caudoviricetes sp.]